MYNKYSLPSGGEEKMPVELIMAILSEKFSTKYETPLPFYGPFPEAPKRPSVTVEQRTIVDVKSNPIFADLHSFYRTGAMRAAAILNLSEGLGYLDLSKSRRILDFGAGSGGPTLALTELAKLNGGTVEAVEAKPTHVQDIIDLGIVSPERVILGDGLKILQTTSERYDLITSFMLGPDDEGGRLTRALLSSSRHALMPGGSILITSDAGTMTTVKRICEQEGVPHDYIQSVPLDGGFLPSAVIASFTVE